MKLRALIELLEEISDDGANDDADVRIMSQPHWPFEYSIAGAIQRQDFECELGEPEEACLNPGDSRSDVFLVEGAQLGYGDKRAWDNV
jgi:hypothetical protein